MESRGRKIQGLWLLQSHLHFTNTADTVLFSCNLTHAQQTASCLLISDSVLKS